MEVSVQRLRVFLAVADTLHFGRAAQRLHTSQPSVSQQVARLERELGCCLFERAPAGVQLTAAGRDLVGFVGSAVRTLDTAVERFVREHAEHRRLRVGLLSSLTGTLVPTAIGSLDCDGFEVALAEGPLALLADRLRKGELDVAFCYRTGAADVLAGLECEVLDRRPVLVALAVNDPAAGQDQLSWPELAARPWIMTSASRHYRDDMLRRFAARRLEISVVAEATTLAGQLALVAAGLGRTFTSPWAAVPDGVVVRRVGEPAEEITLLAVRSSGGDVRLVRRLIDAVRDASAQWHLAGSR